MSKTRSIHRIIESVATSDGAGVKLRRSLGAGPFARLDPFLMLDEFFSDNPDDYIAGFPPHPHRGFETVTYMLDGRMEHRDHLGNTGDLGPGSVQWMTAGRGVIHSEMPKQTDGRMRGFQLWINLPAAEKMRPASYRDIPSSAVPELGFDGGHLRVIAGRVELDGQAAQGPVNGPDHSVSTDPLYVDLRLEPGASVSLPIKDGHNAFVYVYEGEASIGGRTLPHRSAGVLDEGSEVEVVAGPEGGRLLVLAGRPINEPVVQHGPFVMNTREEIEQAMWDYRDGRLTEPA
ncbi:pirin family protein [Wenzhouxiangella marina]|uniref:Quercetin 2,3-dioxygenase n=1 Tax=Wenzhouxiangella marina TaxID=1579979 RepID=A0A0K0Y062_9GAMM|nr:pirin family protein [Wenzhouxiangella marina]AKS43277.1 quercetin 2,3-dioxygenase [Wenzhouxiangella marina]MBB6087036.1 hypothetical protein [Wenzhouxiangella marina]